MPKLANSHRQVYKESAEILNFRQSRADYGYSRYNSKTERYGTLREVNRPKRKKLKKETFSFFNFFICALVCNVLCYAVFI